MKLTIEQLQALGDAGAAAADRVNPGFGHMVLNDGPKASWENEAEARRAFAQEVADRLGVEDMVATLMALYEFKAPRGMVIVSSRMTGYHKAILNALEKWNGGPIEVSKPTSEDKEVTRHER